MSNEIKVNLKNGECFFLIETQQPYTVHFECVMGFYLCLFKGDSSDIVYISKVTTLADFEKKFAKTRNEASEKAAAWLERKAAILRKNITAPASIEDISDNLSIAFAQDLMGRGHFVCHKLLPETGFTLSRIGNIESSDGSVYNASEFWYNRRDPLYHTGWRLYSPTA